MGYFIRILGTEIASTPLAQLSDAARPALLDLDSTGPNEWLQLTLKHASGVEIAVVEKNPVVEGELGYEELQELTEEVSECEPASAVEWLQRYLSGVKVIYAFQLLRGTDVDDGWAILHRVYNAIWKVAGGILQADGEGFTNEAGFTILWQFSENVTGNWNAAVLRDESRWVHFEMDLGDPTHRESFKRGEVPGGAKLL